MNFYVMHRTGKFRPYLATENQCKIKGHKDYEYKIILVFNPAQKLDENKFLIDHQEINDVIEKLKLSGSCEEFQKDIFRKVYNKCLKKGCPPVGYVSSIFPIVTKNEPPAPAFLQYYYAKDEESMKFLSCIK